MPFVKGDPNINREGLNRGSRKEKAFTEYFEEICEEIALANKMDVEDVKKVIYKVGYAKAKEGNYAFYKDMLDRIHGQATTKMEVDQKLSVNISAEDAEKIKNAIQDIAGTSPKDTA